MEVIGAGWGRTGTDSLKVALELLGYKCQHAKVIMSGPKAVGEFWAQALEKKCGPPAQDHHVWEKQAAELDWNGEGFAGGYTACVDFPFSPFYSEIFDANPDAKVVLSVRDSGAAWYKSTYNTISKFYRHRGVLFFIATFFAPFARCQPALWDGYLQGCMGNEEKAIELYNKHIEEVKKRIPADKLLVFNVKQGWEPLCKFLGKPIPDEPFPHVNSSEEMMKRQQMFRNLELGLRGLLLLLASAITYKLFF
eukprot:m.295144 g.295144  ORF g.295144 m.295144 type:complete len:251 (+) comp16393_c6_seq2:247-999(+)